MSILDTIRNIEKHESWLGIAKRVRDRLESAEHKTSHALAEHLRALADDISAEPDVEKPE